MTTETHVSVSDDGGPAFCGAFEAYPSKPETRQDIFQTNCDKCARVINDNLQQVTAIKTVPGYSPALLRQWIVENPDRVVEAFAVHDELIIVHRDKRR